VRWQSAAQRGHAMPHSILSIVRRAALAALIALASLSAATAPVAAAKAPVGYQIFCLKNPGECKGGGASEIALTDEIMQLLKSVNASVNRAIRPRHDKGADVWSANATSGDCEDYVLAKRRALIKAGLPSSALRIAYVKTRKGEGHAILVVVTDGKKWVLDNINGRVRPLSQSGYRLISMSSANPRSWS
jgi:predicted transglutaminase-like cysteine proteinase